MKQNKTRTSLITLGMDGRIFSITKQKGKDMIKHELKRNEILL